MVRTEPSVSSRSLESYCEVIWHSAVLVGYEVRHVCIHVLAH